MTEQTLYPKFYARTGDRARCESGHVVAIFVAPVIGGEAFRPDAHLSSWDIDQVHQTSGRCTCGASWMMGGGAYARAYIGSDWMPTLDDRISAEIARQKAIARLTPAIVLEGA